MKQQNGVLDNEISKKKSNQEDALNDEIVRSFDGVLENDEKIVKGYKPLKSKVYFSKLLTYGIVLLLFLSIVAIAIFVPDENGNAITNKTEIWYALGGFLASFILVITLCLVFTHLYLKHTIYVVTNKRIIIRTGIIGVDFKSLDLKSIGANDVYVSVLDKILCKNTGTIRFGSASSPMTGANMYAFSHVKNPYEIYKEIKQLIAESSHDTQN